MTSESTFSDPPKSSPRPADKAEVNQPQPAATSGVQTGEPDVVEAGYLHGLEPIHGQLKVSIKQKALRQIYDHGREDLSVELGGLLLGTVQKGKEELAIKVLATIPVATADHGPVHFTFTADAWAQVNQTRLAQHPNLDVVGWYHTHPGLGVFFSADDVIVHRAAFVMPWHIALVVDPIRKQGCLFGWKGDSSSENNRDLAPLPGFWEILDQEQAEIRTWDYVNAVVWSEEYQDKLVKSAVSDVYAPDNADWLLPPINPWWGVLLGALSLLISLLLLLDRLLASSP